MRNEQDMQRLILDFAERDERIRAVVLNGSRTDPEAPGDLFQDWDIVYLVTEVEPYVRDRSWIAAFGEMMIMQTPDDMALFPVDREEHGRFGYLMQFADGNRIDLTFLPIEQMHELGQDSLSMLLLDKDGAIAPFAQPSNRDYLPKPPTAPMFADCCNEFWWVSTYVAKGLWRRELPYAKHMYEHPVRAMLHQMLDWLIGARSGYAANPGKQGKYYERHLDEKEWAAYVRTYADGDYERCWEALLAMCGLFRASAIEVAQCCGFAYDEGEDRRVTAHLHRVRALAPDASDYETRSDKENPR